ncbi:MAG TPA: HEAT repeat domain-containing protein [Thermoanaerobaculia bacterium]|jgi:HEAT repeat protein|nr:HEAT repeat domain-containing protein [Thermoanaerobaculia bacterium]
MQSPIRYLTYSNAPARSKSLKPLVILSTIALSPLWVCAAGSSGTFAVSSSPAAGASSSTANADKIKSLIAQLGQGLKGDSSNAINALAKIGAPAVPYLEPLVERDDYHLANDAEIALGLIGPAATQALISALRNTYTVQAAATDLGIIWARNSYGALGDYAWSERTRATATASIPKNLIPSLIAAFDDPARESLGHDDGARMYILEALSRIGVVSPEVIRVFEYTLFSKSLGFKSMTVLSLLPLTVHSKEMERLYERAVKAGYFDRDVAVRFIGPDADDLWNALTPPVQRQTTRGLLNIFETSYDEPVSIAGKALLRVNPRVAVASIDIYLRWIKAENFRYRDNLVQTVGEMCRFQPDNPERFYDAVIPTLLAFLDSKSEKPMPRAITRTTDEILGVSRRASLYRETYVAIKNHAARGKLSERQRNQLVEAMSRRIKPPNPYRDNAIEILGFLGHSARSIVPLLMTQYDKETEGRVRKEIIIALGNIGDARAIPKLREILRLRDPDSEEHRHAEQALRKIQTGNG